MATERGIQASYRALLFLVYGITLAALGVPAILRLEESLLWGSDVILQGALLIAIPSVMLAQSVASRHHNLALSVWWVWSLLFLGLAPAYQLGVGRLPWGARPSDDDVSMAQRIVLFTHALVFAAYIASSRRNQGGRNRPPSRAPTGENASLRRTIIVVIVLHLVIASLFCALMGGSLFSGRATFQAQLAARAAFPGFGSAYFLSNAGAIAIPAMAIVLKKRGVDVPAAALFLSLVLSFLVTNPLIGSRFLTGSFLVAVIAASTGPLVRRFIPISILAAFVTVFPTLDVLRGDGTGAARVAISSPEINLLTFDFDAFEMLTRELMMDGDIREGLPNRASLLVAPFLRWVPGLSQLVQGDASGPVVGASTGMTFRNVSMPLWGEAHLIGSWFGVTLAFIALGLLLGRTSNRDGHGGSLFGVLIEFPTAALLFIILRGSLYEVLGYLILAAAIAWILGRASTRGQKGPTASEGLESVVATRANSVRD